MYMIHSSFHEQQSRTTVLQKYQKNQIRQLHGLLEMYTLAFYMYNWSPVSIQTQSLALRV